MKKKLFILLMILLSTFSLKNVSASTQDVMPKIVVPIADNLPQVDEGTYNNNLFFFCNDQAVLKIFRIAGTVFDIIKIIVPVLLIIMATISVGKAVLSGDEKDIKSAGTSSAKKAVAAIIIFFLPLIIEVVLNLIPSYNAMKYYDRDAGEYSAYFGKCTYCFFNPSEENCDNRGTVYYGSAK